MNSQRTKEKNITSNSGDNVLLDELNGAGGVGEPVLRGVPQGGKTPTKKFFSNARLQTCVKSKCVRGKYFLSNKWTPICLGRSAATSPPWGPPAASSGTTASASSPRTSSTRRSTWRSGSTSSSPCAAAWSSCSTGRPPYSSSRSGSLRVGMAMCFSILLNLERFRRFYIIFWRIGHRYDDEIRPALKFVLSRCYIGDWSVSACRETYDFPTIFLSLNFNRHFV